MKNSPIHSSGTFKPYAPVPSSSKIMKAFSRRPNVILVMLLSVSPLLHSQFSNAQAPQQFSFQGVARDATGKILANKSIMIGIDIHQGNANGTIVLSEVHNVSTNANGIFNLKVGSITSMDNVNWDASSYFLQVSMLYDGLQSVVDLGTTQLLSVPYSLQSLQSTNATVAEKAVKADSALVSKKWIDDEPIVQTGSDAAGSPLPDVTNGNMLIWYPKNAAFRAGKNSGNTWNRATMGVNSFATGEGTLASGLNSASFGNGTEATGAGSFAIGNSSKASGNYSFAAGDNSEASGGASTAIGKNAQASSIDAFATGLSSKATGLQSIAIGNAAESSGSSSIAIGEQSVASGLSAAAIGHATSASGNNSMALGYQAVTSGNNAVSLGYRTTSKSFGGISTGIFNNTTDNPAANSPTDSDRLFQIGNGASNANRSNALTILRNGNIGIGNNVLAPEYVMDFGGRPRVRHNGATAGIHFNNSQNQEDGFVGMKTDDQIGFYCNNQWQFWVDNNASYSHGAMVQVSDKRLKTNIIPFSESSLLPLANLTGYHYNWLDPKRSQSRQTGLIAQEVEKYFPLLVNTDQDGYKAVNYIGLIPHLIEAVKELDKRTQEVAALKKELAEVREINKRVMALEAGLKSLLTENKSAIGKSQAK